MISIERHVVLAEQARAVITKSGIQNVRIIAGDGTRGFAESAPYDVIVASAAAPTVPPELVAQLVEGGRMIMPVGGEDAQQLQLIEKRNGEARVSLRELCRFVPLVPGEA